MIEFEVRDIYVVCLGGNAGLLKEVLRLKYAFNFIAGAPIESMAEGDVAGHRQLRARIQSK